MADGRVRLYLLDAFLKLALIANITILIIGIVMLLVSNSAYGIYASGIGSASALFNCIGLTLVLRWHRSGLAFIVPASLSSAVTLPFVCAGWLVDTFGSIGVLVPYVMALLYLFVLFALLIIKQNGLSAWQQMDNSLDFVHSKHIYELSAALLFFVVLVTVFSKPSIPLEKKTAMVENDDIDKITPEVSEERLDSPDITIEEVVSYEKKYYENVSVDEREKRITNRIFALKHLLLSGLMPAIHSRENLVNICMYHAGAFSIQQQEIIDWYLALDISQQSIWNVCEKAHSLTEFKWIVLNSLNRPKRGKGF